MKKILVYKKKISIMKTLDANQQKKVKQQGTAVQSQRRSAVKQQGTAVQSKQSSTAVQSQRRSAVKQSSTAVQSQQRGTAILFVDNDSQYFKGADRLGIDTFHVDDTVPNSLLQMSKATYDFMVINDRQNVKKRYKEQYQRAYGQMKSNAPSQLLLLYETGSGQIPMPCMGMTDTDIEQIKIWCTTNQDKKKKLLLDWDRTLSVLEGGIKFDDDLSTPVKDLEAYTAFLLGGRDRLRKIREFFDYMYSNRVDVYILTNSGWCLKDHPNPEFRTYYQAFKNIINVVDPRIDDEHMLCSSSVWVNKRDPYSNKMLFLKNKWNLVEKKV